MECMRANTYRSIVLTLLLCSNLTIHLIKPFSSSTLALPMSGADIDVFWLPECTGSAVKLGVAVSDSLGLLPCIGFVVKLVAEADTAVCIPLDLTSFVR